MAASPRSEQLPVLGDMSPMCQSLIHVIEEQLGATYCNDIVSADCAEFKKTPNFLELAKTTLKDPERVFLQDDKYNVTLYGDQQRLILVTTKPYFKVTIRQEYVADLSSGVATHKINLRLCSHEGSWRNKTCGLCGHVSYLPLNPPISQPFVILIYNVVETRISRVRAKDNMKSFGYCHAHQLDPFGYLGGEWLLWNCNDVDLDVTMKKMAMLDFETLESVLDTILNPSINSSLKKLGIPPTLVWDNLVAIEKTLDLGSYINDLVLSEAFFVLGTLPRETRVEKLVEDEFKEAKACAIREAEVPTPAHWVVDTLKRVIFPRKLPFVKLFAVPSDVRETSIVARSYTEIDSLQRVVSVVIMPLCHRNANIIWEGVNGGETDPQLAGSWWGPEKNSELSDRFIPSAINPNYVEIKEEEGSAYQKILAEALGMNRTRILAFKKKPPKPMEFYPPFYPPEDPSASVHPTRRRRIPRGPDRALDVPGFVDNFYLKLLDWGCNNVVLITVGDGVHLWDASDEISDRFIPMRSAMNFDFAHYMVTGGKSIKEKEPSASAYQKILAEALGMNRTQILAFKKKPPKPMEFYPPEDPSASVHPARRRRIPRGPDRALDVSGFVDDFYLNLLDWSCNNVVLTAVGDGVHLWDASDGSNSELVTVDAEIGPVTSVSRAPDGRHVAVGLNNSEVELWDSVSHQRLRTLKGCHSGRVGSLAWNNNDILTTGGMDGQILNNDVRIQSPVVGAYRGHRSEVCGLKWSTSGQQLASGGEDNLVHIWDRSMASSNSPRQWLHMLEDHTCAVKAISWCPFQRNLLATGGGEGDRSIKFWNSHTGACLNSVETGSQISGLLWSKNERELLSSHGFPRNQLTLWKYPSLVKMAELTDHTSRVLHMA
ncbi:hypothetical protein CCACVL1_07681 [Corchorus capsularis]|uniref:CDC20/Fizzy WD40 domain-containing protein n=1 Tax=Corchorus capsularis TaxID=210143 RepID=A0A1R3J4G5_COCAP|nr:hypothetical protein CCACVL1_07681 [Corchorus capsularis]